MGDGGLRLLLGILRYGSLLKAAHAIGWSYRHAWGYLRRAEDALGTALVASRSGKGRARGMDLTDTGRRLLDRLQAAREQIDKAVGPSGPTDAEIAARAAAIRLRQGRARRHPPA
ncbi:MAG TPA: LysR family transcriptional regulator [Candidatus Binatia bacterium]|nr:LysR family transcriptional regulator [Candidatus Binatia bacterium]